MAIKQHTYGSGEISFAPFLAGTQTPGALRYIGNTTEFTLSSEQETLSHFDTDHGVKVEDDEIITQTTQSGTVVTDNIDLENVGMFFMAVTASITIASGTGVIDLISAVQFGKYQLGATPTLPTGLRHVTNVVVTNTTTPATTYAAGVDYVVDPDRGLIDFLEGGALVKGTGVTVTFSNAASTRAQVASGAKPIEGKLFFQAFNARGPQTDYMMPWVKFTPNGDFALKGDDWLSLPFNVKVLKKGALAPVYADGQAVTS